MSNGFTIYRALIVTVGVLWTVGCSSSELIDEVQCDNGAERAIPCGFKDNGVQGQRCVDYQWVDEGRCEDPTVCFGNETRTGVEPCGLNGRGDLREQCDAGQWTPVDNVAGHPCSTDDDPQSCACIDPDECVDGQEEASACGFDDSGEQLYRCVDGQWNQSGACHGAYECVAPDDKEVEGFCGINGRGTQRFACTDEGMWEPTTCDDNDICEEGRFREGECAQIGSNNRPQLRRSQCAVVVYEDEDGHMQERAEWGGWSACEDSELCAEGSQEIIACGDDHGSASGEQHRVCENGEWVSEGCWQQAQFIYEAPYSFLIAARNNEFRVVGDNQHRTAGTSDLIVFPTKTQAVNPEGSRQRFSASESHQCAINPEGNVECWGSNAYGQLGEEPAVQETSAVPVWVRGPLEGRWAHAVSVGEGFSCALVTATKESLGDGGDVYCWGRNNHHQLGRDDDEAWNATPQKVQDLDGVRAVGAGEAHVCAVKDNAVYCWGANDAHQASARSDDTIASPTRHETLSHDPGRDQSPPYNGKACAPELLESKIIALAVGRNHTLVSWKTRWREQSSHASSFCYLHKHYRKNLNLIGVGSNSHGQLAHTLDETVVKEARAMLHEQLRSSRPIVSPRPMDGQFIPRAMGDVSCVFRELNGELTYRRCTGDNSEGQLHESAEHLITLTDIPNDLSNGEEITELAIGYDSLCVLLRNTRRIRCRGGNAYGQLGDGTTDSRRESRFMMHAVHADD